MLFCSCLFDIKTGTVGFEPTTYSLGGCRAVHAAPSFVSMLDIVPTIGGLRYVPSSACSSFFTYISFVYSVRMYWVCDHGLSKIHRELSATGV